MYWVYLGLGQHIVYVHTPKAKLRLVLFIMRFTYNTGLTLVKLSVLMLYARIFGTVRGYRIAFWIVGFVVVAWCIAMNFANLFGCVPIHKSWDISVPGHCVSIKAHLFGGAILNILTDLALLLLPMPGLWRLQMSTRRKVGVVGVFISGYLWVGPAKRRTSY